MSDELLVTFIGAGAAIVGGLVTGAFDQLRQWYTRPKLRLDYLNNRANRIESSYEVNQQHISEIFIRARLRNTGRRVARDCRVFLIGLHEINEGNTHDTSFHDSMQLTWPGYPKDFAARVIPAGIEAYVDVVSIQREEKGWRFQVKGLYASQKSLKDYKGTYRIKLLATADNAEPSTLEIDVYYDQDWHSLRATTSHK